jgi:hypothetical protein
MNAVAKPRRSYVHNGGYGRRGTVVAATYSFALWVWPRFLTNSSTHVHSMKNFMMVPYDDTSYPCSGTIAGLLTLAMWVTLPIVAPKERS